MNQSRKQHRRGRKTSRKLANLEAISQAIENMEITLFREGPIVLCLGCEAELTSADYEAGECAQCQTKIRRIA